MNKEWARMEESARAAYKKLRSTEGYGLYASAGTAFNHTFFGRDAATEARLMVRDDPEMSRDVILSLARLQGQRIRRASHEEPGAIHHEHRVFSMWEATFKNKMAFRMLSGLWGGNSRKMTTYFTADATPAYVNLVYTYVEAHGSDILEWNTARDDQVINVADSVLDAVRWIMAHYDGELGLITTSRPNRLSLYFPVFQDSLTSYSHPNKRLANIRQSMAFLEVQAQAVDALRHAAKMFENHGDMSLWLDTADIIAERTLQHFWQPGKHYFVAALDRNHRGEWRQVNMDAMNAGWILDSSLFDHMNEDDKRAYIEPVVRKLLSEDFLTAAGLRSRALTYQEPVRHTVSYHGSLTVWPLFTFLVAEGLRRQGLYELARELDERIMQTMAKADAFSEYFIVLPSGTVFLELTKNKFMDKRTVLGLQKVPEDAIGLSVVAALVVLKNQRTPKKSPVKTSKWQAELEKEVLKVVGTIPTIETMTSKEPLVYDQKRGIARTSRYIFKQLFKLYSERQNRESR